jgi:RNA polymerase sigma factor (TIGR02999 family)
MSDLTRILRSIDDGDPKAAEELLPLVYDELRKLAAAKMAAERPGQTLQATALVHEAYVRLVDVEKVQQWASRGHFFAAAAEAMRRILIEDTRRKLAAKRGGELERVPQIEIQAATSLNPLDLLALDEALSKLEQEEPVRAELVKLRFFAGLSIEEAASTLNISKATAKRYWIYARAWLFQQLADPNVPR